MDDMKADYTKGRKHRRGKSSLGGATLNVAAAAAERRRAGRGGGESKSGRK